jgi:hypothetical protein
MKMGNQNLANEVLDQFNRVFYKFRKALEAIPDEEWQIGESNYQRPAGLADHFLSTIDYYTSNLTADEFPWGKRLGSDWEDPNSDVLPSKALVLDYLEEMEARLVEWTSATDFMEEDFLHPYCGKTILGRAFYIIRHSESHLGEISLELRRRSLPGPEWR